MATVTHDAKAVRGDCCPACGRASGILRERRTESFDTGDVATAALLGWLGFVAVMLGRSRVRLRCTHCQCQFPEPPGVLRICVIGAALALLFWFIFDIAVAAAAGQSVGHAGGAVGLILAGALTVLFLLGYRRRMSEWRERISAEERA